MKVGNFIYYNIKELVVIRLISISKLKLFALLMTISYLDFVKIEP